MKTSRRIFGLRLLLAIAVVFGCVFCSNLSAATLKGSDTGTVSISYPIVDTGQAACYDDMAGIGCPGAGEAFSGQDAQHDGNQPDHTDNGNGTVTDNVTGLMWQQGFADTKLTYAEAQTYVNALNTQHYCGYSDWRLPTIKELYSLIDFRGTDPPPERTDITGLVPFIDTDYFDFAYGHIEAGERIIDSQWVTRTLYTANANMVFGVNFADGRIKGYGMASPDPLRPEMRFYVRLCRGNTNYGTNSLVNNNDGTVTDVATGLMWTQSDSGQGMIWEDALAWVEQKNAENYLGHSDWRLPNAKELQSIVDYTRSPDTTGSAAISPVFSVTEIINLAGEIDYPYFWTGTTHVSSDGLGARAVYVAFGRGLGEIHGEIVDIHGAGCQRSDPKFGEEEDFPASGFGPQGDVRCVFNYVRCVRGAESELARINLTSPADGSALHYAPTFTWIPDGGTDNRYVVDFRVPGLVSLRTTPVLSSPSWTMPNAMEFRPAWCKGILASASN